jgi:murein DD-endopeptidase MepM/ murein hydrolase activator NlpD
MLMGRSRQIIKAMSAVLMVVVVATGPAWAKKMYKYVDEDGVTHYTDRKPNTEQEVETRQVRVEEQPLVTARRVDARNTNTYHFFNHWHGPVEIKVSFGQADNVYSDPPLPTNFVMLDYGEQPLVVISPKEAGRAWGFRLEYESVPGDPRQQADMGHRYRIPFRTSERYYIGQGFGGIATHTDKHSYHALDISMPVGTPILAARDGIVMHMEKDFYGAGLDRDKYGSRANFVRILHEDGTMAVYAHLDLESVSVRPGSTVLAGELIGLSGNTGMSSGPHLHFVLQRNTGTTLESIPFRFDNGRGGAIDPVAGTWLESRR